MSSSLFDKDFWPDRMIEIYMDCYRADKTRICVLVLDPLFPTQSVSQKRPSESIRSRRLCEDAAFERKHTCVSDGSSNQTSESYPLPCVMNSQTAVSKTILLIGKNATVVIEVQATDVPTA